MDLSGKWTGFHEFGQGYEPPYFGKRVKIHLKITDRDDGFEGICTEEPSAFSINEVSSIQGFVDDTMISFIKTYKNYHQITTDHEVSVIPNQELEVNYYGDYSKEFDCFYGVWEIDMGEIENEEGIFTQIVSGIWQIERIN